MIYIGFDECPIHFMSRIRNWTKMEALVQSCDELLLYVIVRIDCTLTPTPYDVESIVFLLIL